MSKSLSSFVKKERLKWFARIILKREWFARKNICQFFTVFPLFMPKSESLQLLFAQSLFFKDQREWFTSVAIYKRATVSNSLFFMSESLFCSQKRANRSKNRRAKSQPCLFPSVGTYFQKLFNLLYVDGWSFVVSGPIIGYQNKGWIKKLNFVS